MAVRTGSQLIVATHSQVIINSVDARELCVLTSQYLAPRSPCQGARGRIPASSPPMRSRIELLPGMVIRGPVLPEAVEILTVASLGTAVRVMGKGVSSGLVRDVVLTPEQLDQLQIPPIRQPFDGDATLFRLGIEAQRLGLPEDVETH